MAHDQITCVLHQVAHRLLRCCTTLTCLGLLAGTGSASITWQWSFGTEAGNFITDGDLVAGVAPAATYNVVDFAVTQSAFPGALGSISMGLYDEGTQPGTGFMWDGTADTQWFRAGGTYTNGANYYRTPAPPYRYLFEVGYYRVSDEVVGATLLLTSTLTLTPGPGGSGTTFCFGDGSDGGVCPCGNIPGTGSGEGCANGTGLGAFLTASGSAAVTTDSLVLTVNQAVPNEFGIFVQNISAAASPTPFYNGLLCLSSDSHLVRHYAPPMVQPTVTDAAGSGVNAQLLTLGDYLGDTQPGVTMYYQFWGRDNSGPCGTGANFSSGLFLTWQL